MTAKQQERLDLMIRIREKSLTQREAARILDVSVRQVERIYRRFRECEPDSPLAFARGIPDDCRISPLVKQKILTLLRLHYQDAGPTLAARLLEREHDVKVSRETLRHWMIEENLWIPRPRQTQRQAS